MVTYTRCLCKSTFPIEELDGVLSSNDNFKTALRLAELIGKWCMFEEGSEMGREFDRCCDALWECKGIFRFTASSDEITFTADIVFEEEPDDDVGESMQLIPGFNLSSLDIEKLHRILVRTTE